MSMSHPAWVCGLKPLCWTNLKSIRSHTLRGCVDWNQRSAGGAGSYVVTPCVGVWIETDLSALSIRAAEVTPCVGVWIETNLIPADKFKVLSHPAWVCGLKPRTFKHQQQKRASHPAWVCGLKLWNIRIAQFAKKSHPAWVCGLKLTNGKTSSLHGRHTLRGCVDWNPLVGNRRGTQKVTPCVGVWIETLSKVKLLKDGGVTPCVGVWIETRKRIWTVPTS